MLSSNMAQNISRAQIIEILRVGLRAVSPYNLQPWEFDFKDGILRIFAKYEPQGFLGHFKDVIYYSLGALLENLSQGARFQRFEMAYRLRDWEPHSDQVLCEVTLTPSPNLPSSDITHVLSRYTNRKVYESRQVPSAVLDNMRLQFRGPARGIIDVTGNIDFIDFSSRIETVRVSNNEMLDEFIHILSYTPKEAEVRRWGLDLRVLEVPERTHIFMKVARSVTFRRVLGRIPLCHLSARVLHRKMLINTPLLVVFEDSDHSPESLVKDWMNIQRIINDLHKAGLSSHLIASSVDMTKINRDFFSPTEQKILQESEEGILKATGVKAKDIQTILRVGYAKESLVRSLRKNPEDILRP